MIYANSISQDDLKLRGRVKLELEQHLLIALAPWLEGRPSGAARVAASLDSIKAALRALGDRDRDGSKAWLEARRVALATALNTFNGFGATLDGPAAEDLIDRIVIARRAVEAAQLQFNAASRSEVKAARDLLDLEAATLREVLRECDALRTALRFPQLIAESIFDEARTASEYLAQPGNELLRLHIALDAGRSASIDESKIWICFEPPGVAEAIYEARYQRAVLARNAAAPAPAPAIVNAPAVSDADAEEQDAFQRAGFKRGIRPITHSEIRNTDEAVV